MIFCVIFVRITKACPKVSAPPAHRHQKIVVQASTSDLLRCFASFVDQRCSHLYKEKQRFRFDPRETISWIRIADRALLVQGWQDVAFLNPVNVVFFFMMVRDSLRPVDIHTVYDLQCNIMACLYLAFSYMGNEISYPLKPFLVESNRDVFWQRTISLMSQLSGNMLRVNQDARFFTELFYELKSYNVHLANPHIDQASISTFKSVPNSYPFNTVTANKQQQTMCSDTTFTGKNLKVTNKQNESRITASKNNANNKLVKPANSSQLIPNKASQALDDPALFYANVHTANSDVHDATLLPKLDMSISKLKPQCFKFLNKSEQYVMYGSNNEEPNLTYCI